MSKHKSHVMHDNSMEAWWSYDGRTRKECVLLVLKVSGRPMTDREICLALGSQDLNYARPAITGLIQDGQLFEVDDVVCSATNRTVRRTWLSPDGADVSVANQKPVAG